ncbi:MAG: hypothetical protein ACQKBV_00450 [Puniceicoccales bacterium]
MNTPGDSSEIAKTTQTTIDILLGPDCPAPREEATVEDLSLYGKAHAMPLEAASSDSTKEVRGKLSKPIHAGFKESFSDCKKGKEGTSRSDLIASIDEALQLAREGSEDKAYKVLEEILAARPSGKVA